MDARGQFSTSRSRFRRRQAERRAAVRRRAHDDHQQQVPEMKKRGLSQAQTAKLFGVTQPRVSDLVRGKTELFSIDTLVRMLARARVRVDVRTSLRSPQPSATKVAHPPPERSW